VDPGEVIHLTIRLHRRTPTHRLLEAVRDMAARPPAERRHLSREEYETTYGADPAAIDKVVAFATGHGLRVDWSSAARRSVRVSGSAEAVSKAFDVQLEQYRHGDSLFRRRTGQGSLPADVAPLVEAVIGFDNRPYARPHYRIRKPADGAVQPHATADFSPTELGKLYHFPPNTDGSGQVIGIIELMMPHGSGFRPAELKQYFTALGVANPEVVAVGVDGGKNEPGHDPNDRQCGDGEVMLDIEVVGALAPKAKIVVYFAPNTAQGFLDVITKAVHDTDHSPTVISLSWGSHEDPTDPTTQQINETLQAAAAMGITFAVASGDSGSRDDPDHPDQAAVDFPASSPFALACGGTSLAAAGGSITSEVAWPNSGGGVSRLFDLPDYQQQAGVPAAKNPPGSVGRGVPDVSGDADPATGYRVVVDGQHLTFGGTSAVAPLWAALAARLNQKLGHPVGFLNPVLYAHPQACNDITGGDNGDYQAGPDWDPCTGLGSPDGARLLEALSQIPAPV
jgi:kumamolisin